MITSAANRFPRGPRASPPIRVVLSMDDAMERRALRLRLHARGGIDVVAETASNQAAARLAGTYEPCVLILDGEAGQGLPIEIISELPLITRDTRVIVLTEQQDPAVIGEAFRAGAVGYVLKISASEELLRAVRSAARGHMYLTPGLGARLGAMPVAGDSPREVSSRQTTRGALTAPGTKA